MPLTLQNTATPVTPNTAKYDLSIASRIIDGRLVVMASIVMQAARCDIVDGHEVWTECPLQPKGWTTADLEQFAGENPDIASAVLTAWGAISACVEAINAKQQLV